MSERYANDWRERVRGCRHAWTRMPGAVGTPPLSASHMSRATSYRRENNKKAEHEPNALEKERRGNEKPYAIPIKSKSIDVYLLQSLVVNKTGSIFGNLKLALLNLLAKFPAVQIAM